MKKNVKRETYHQCFTFHVLNLGGSAWESNPPRLATRPVTDVEDREAHRDLTTPTKRILEGCKGYKVNEAILLEQKPIGLNIVAQNHKSIRN